MKHQKSVSRSQSSHGHASLLQSALSFHQQGRLAEADALYQKILRFQPGHFDALQLLATSAGQQKKFSEAVELFKLALSINPVHSASLNNLGNALQELKRYEEALLSYDRAIAVNPDNADTYYNQGVVLQALKRNEEAVLSYERALALKPGYALAQNNLAFALLELKRYKESLASYDKAISLNPNFPEPYYNRGNALLALSRYQEAAISYDRAVVLKPDYAEAYCNRGNALLELRRYEEALLSYDKTYEIRPDFNFILGKCQHIRMKICDWRKFDHHVHELAKKIELHEKVSGPFPFLSLKDSLFLQKKAAEIYVQAKHPFTEDLPKIPKRDRHEKIRIGYFSADFHDHPMMHLMAGLFEKHDRTRFELIAFSFGPDTKGEMRKRAEAAFDRFIDVRMQSDKDIAKLSRDLNVDIAIDRKGYTKDCRTGIFAFRAAPVQVNYLAYPGTLGAEYIDYIIADRTLIPESSRQYYSEKIVFLPDCYQANDENRLIADKVFTRKESGLPETGFVFCCFNNNHKIIPATFDGWMRILRQIEGSVLWLFESNQTAAENLRRAAVDRGVDSNRLVFAHRLPNPEHLARHRSADLFLDTLPYNAHTTTSDALWAGLPVLTCIGESFASRVAASLLNAIQLPELITSTQEEYEALAVELATNPDKLAAIRRKLEKNRLTTPLFDTGRFTRHIEQAYTAMYERYQADLPPDHIEIKAS